MLFQEIVHIAIRERIHRALPEYQAVLTKALPARRRFDWLDLYKVRTELLESISPDREQLRLLLDVNGLEVVQPHSLGPLPRGRLWEEELLRLVGRYPLGINDAAMLLDAQRAGITSMATFDADLRRAQRDFDIFTWL